jgi:hypothetical protein
MFIELIVLNKCELPSLRDGSALVNAGRDVIGAANSTNTLFQYRNLPVGPKPTV